MAKPLTRTDLVRQFVYLHSQTDPDAPARRDGTPERIELVDPPAEVLLVTARVYGEDGRTMGYNEAVYQARSARGPRL
jgi:hypothetical protein